MERYLKVLRDNHFKLTPRRLAVLELFNRERKLFTPEQIWTHLKKQFIRLGIPTIYRILEQYDQLGILRRHRGSDPQFRYYLCSDPGKESHHHFVCCNCNRVFCLDFCAYDALEKAVNGQIDAEIHDHNLHIEGLCSRCRRSVKNNS